MGFLGPVSRQNMRATITRWLLLGCILRALLPVGHMPRIDVPSSADFQVVICATMGTAMQMAAADGLPAGDHNRYGACNACVFCGLPQLSEPSMAVSPLDPPVRVVLTEAWPSSPDTAVAHAGPHVGARAPPSLS